MGTKVISFINLKGGVAKTTTTVGTAFALAHKYEKRVLVIDLDPQTNATVMLIGDKGWKQLDEAHSTIYDMFYDILEDEEEFDIHRAIQHDVGNVKDAKGIDLLCSHLKMVELSDRLPDIKNKRDFSVHPYFVLSNNLKDVMDDYDYILIDCPPNLGILTLNGIVMSNCFVIPSIPDILSTYGIPQILSRIAKVAKNQKLTIPCLGIVFTKVKKSSRLHSDTMREMRITSETPVFETVFPDSVRTAEAAAYDELPMTVLQKWGYYGNFDRFEKFAGEIVAKMEEEKDE